MALGYEAVKGTLEPEGLSFMGARPGSREFSTGPVEVIEFKALIVVPQCTGNHGGQV